MRRRAILDRRRGVYVKDQSPPPGELWFDYVNTYPAQLRLHTDYRTPLYPEKAQYSVDGGDTWRNYTSKTISLPAKADSTRSGGFTLGFRGDWRDSLGRLSFWLQASFLTAYPVRMRGTIPVGELCTSPVPFMFERTFTAGDNKGLLNISPHLFEYIRGAPAEGSFKVLFQHHSSIIEPIPPQLFRHIKGPPAEGMFEAVFMGMTSVPGPFPKGIFDGISGDAKPHMYRTVFYNDSNLTGSIPPNFFGRITGTPQYYMYRHTFWNCTSLTGSIPDGLFGDFTEGYEEDMFGYTFTNCSGLSGDSPKTTDGIPLYQFFDSATATHVKEMYKDCNFTDQASIPAAWK